jgi:peptidyl-prolyl cis-trans isomerase A (cyclophilin A)
MLRRPFALALPFLLAAGPALSCSSTSAAPSAADAGIDTSPAAPIPDAAIAPIDATPEPQPDAASIDAGPDPLLGCTRDPGAPTITVDPNSATDPTGGADKFTLAKALDGFPAGTGKLTASIRTEYGYITCALFDDKAPISVANFIGLARGTRPYKTKTGWTVGKFYDGLIWHRVIPDFVIQGGDPLGKGTGGPGYSLVNENQVDEPAGTLAMAASDVPSGSQFYVVVGTGPAAEYNVFGMCNTQVAIAIAGVERGPGDKPKVAVHMQRIEIGRCP